MPAHFPARASVAASRALPRTAVWSSNQSRSPGAVLNRRKLCVNRRAVVVQTVHGAAELPLLFAPGVVEYRRAATRGGEDSVASGHLQEDGISAFTYHTSRRLHQRGFERVVARLPRDVKVEIGAIAVRP